MRKNLEYGLNQLYPTPVYLTRITDEECAELFTAVMQNEDVTSPHGSDNSRLIHKIPLLEKLAHEKFDEYFQKVFQETLDDYQYKFKAWLTGSKGGYSMETHNHSGSPFVSVFYVLSESADKGGEIVLTDPRVNANRGYSGKFIEPFKPTVFMPKTGDVLIFPGYLYHHVRQYQSNLRIAIPVDLFLIGDE